MTDRHRLSKRVLFVHSSAGRYGADRSLLILVTGLRARGWTTTVLLPTAGTLKDELVAAGAEVHIGTPGALRKVFTPREWLSFAIVDLPKSIVTVWRLARGVEIVHVNTSVILGAMVGTRLARRPLVVHVRESYAGQQRMWRTFARLLRRLASAVIANSDAVAVEAKDVGLGDRTVAIANALDLGAMPPDRVPEGPVVTTGRINSWKGQGVLVDAIALLRDRGVIVSALIAGDAFAGGEDFSRDLAERIAREGLDDQVTLLGFVDDVTSLLDSSSIFVLPSVRPEPFGLSLLEAMGRALPVIATDAGGPRQIVRHGETGILVPPGDSGALADAIARLWQQPDLRHRLGRAGAIDARERFGVSRLIDAVEAVYADVLAHRLPG